MGETNVRVSATVVALLLFLSVNSLRADTVVNIDATKFGFKYPSTGISDPAPVIGQVITPITASSSLNQLTLGPGTYNVTNATGLPGANSNFTAWQFNGTSPVNWVWSFVIADDSTDKVLLYAGYGALSSKAAMAADPNVTGYSGSFTLATTTTVDFMVRDYFLDDNAGGVALNIHSAAAAVPIPSSALAGGTLLLFLVGCRISRSKYAV